MKNLFYSLLIMTCLSVISFTAMSNSPVSTEVTCEEMFNPTPILIDNHVYMEENGTQSPCIKLENMESFHNHFTYFYNQQMRPHITEWTIDEVDILIIECAGKYYYY